MTDPSGRPRPTPDGSRRAAAALSNRSVQAGRADDVRPPERVVNQPPHPLREVIGEQPALRVDVAPSQVVAAAGTAIVAAARMGRMLGRSGWRIARQLPGGRRVEREAQRLQHVALDEARRLLQVPTAEPGPVRHPARTSFDPVPGPEQRAADYIRRVDPSAAPLRAAMGELLERSVEATRDEGQQYLFGTIISQLVPDEARILAALADGTSYASFDVLGKQRRGPDVTLVANACAVGRQAGLVSPESTPTYVTRLAGFGLVEFGPEDERLSVQYDVLETDATVQRAHATGAASRRHHGVRLVRKTLRISEFGREFWTASDPTRPALPRP